MVPVHVTTGRAYDGANRHFFYECLSLKTGRRDRRKEALCFVDAFYGKAWHDEGEHELLRTKKNELTLCDTRTKKRPVQVRWHSMSVDEEKPLISFLGMIQTPAGGAYSQTLKESLQREREVSFEKMFRESIRACCVEPTFRERRQAQALPAPPQTVSDVTKIIH